MPKRVVWSGLAFLGLLVCVATLVINLGCESFPNQLAGTSTFGGQAYDGTREVDPHIVGVQAIGAAVAPGAAPIEPMPAFLAHTVAAFTPPAPKPQVWKQTSNRPTVARVSVGDGNSLDVVSILVGVTVDGPRARTTVDYVYHNPHDKQLEGTFEYPLPSGATPSYYAMFPGQSRDKAPPHFAATETVKDHKQPPPDYDVVTLPPTDLVKKVDTTDWGAVKEARVVSSTRALETYEDVTRHKIDPALLEYAGGNTFTGRVFPIPGKGFTRIVLTYEETLPVVSGKVMYRFPLPECKLDEISITAQSKTDAIEFTSPAAEERYADGDTVKLRKCWKDKGPGGDAIYTCTAPEPKVQAITGRDGEDGSVCMYARVRPGLKVEASKPFSDTAVFLLDVSLSENPDRFNVNMKLLKKILESDPDIKRFNILTFNAGTAWVDSNGLLPNTAEFRKKAFERLDGIVLEGATDISAALKALCDLEPGCTKLSAWDEPLNVFLLSDGQATWGNRETASLAAHFESRCKFPVRFHCYRVGIGAENQELFQALTRNGGGIFQCHSEAEIDAAAVAHRHQCLQIQSVRVEGGTEARDVFVAGRRAAVYPGGEVIVAARLKKTGKANIVLEGTYLGKPFHEEYPVTVDATSELAPRAWAEVAVGSLLALNDPKLDDLITAYSQRYSIGSRVASFLILENETDYKRYNIEDESKCTLAGDAHARGDLGQFVLDAWSVAGQERSRREELDQFLGRLNPRAHLFEGKNGDHVKKLIETLSDQDLELPVSNIHGEPLHKKDLPSAYVKALNNPDRDVVCFLTEAERRSASNNPEGAVRALSGVIEQYPARGDALRVVGYRLLDLKQPAAAANLFAQVEHSRPFEPHSYRDLARSLEDCGKYGLAALNYEIVLAGEWDSRFKNDLKKIVQEEYAQMMHDALKRQSVHGKLADVLGDRLEGLTEHSKPCDLRVTIAWNTDNTDVDLWVFDPSGEKCFYNHRKTSHGGELTEDCTQGYGPERFQAVHAVHGEYKVVVHYFNPNPNLLAGETHVQVRITSHAGMPEEETIRKTIVLKKAKQEIEVGKVKF